MRVVGLKVLKNKLSEYVRLVASGETVLVTDRDRVVAELIPPRPGRAETVDDARLADLVRSGLVEPPTLAGMDPPPSRPIGPTAAVLEDLERDRRER